MSIFLLIGTPNLVEDLIGNLIIKFMTAQPEDAGLLEELRAAFPDRLECIVLNAHKAIQALVTQQPSPVQHLYYYEDQSKWVMIIQAANKENLLQIITEYWEFFSLFRLEIQPVLEVEAVAPEGPSLFGHWTTLGVSAGSSWTPDAEQEENCPDIMFKKFF